MSDQEMSIVKVFYGTYPSLRGATDVWDWVQKNPIAAEGLVRVNHTGLRRRCVRRLRETGTLPEEVRTHLIRVVQLWEEGCALHDQAELWLAFGKGV